MSYRKMHAETEIQYRFTVYGSDGSEWTTDWMWPDIEGYWLKPQMPDILREYAKDVQTTWFGAVPNDGKRVYKIETREVTYGEPVLLGTGGSETS